MVQVDAVDMFVVKLMKVEGLYKANYILGIAQATGIKGYAVSMTSLGIGHTANLHFAIASALEDRYSP